MNKDRLVSILVIFITIVLVYVLTRPLFLEFVANNRYLGGFIKFFLLASLGDVIGKRLKTGSWGIPLGFFFKAIVWGVIGIMVTFVFPLYSNGITSLQESGMLISGYKIIYAFFVSLVMNLTFAPVMMSFHRITDTVIDYYSVNSKYPKEVLSSIDWEGFIRFTVLRTIPFFWIPAHTITFMLPKEYQVVFAAVLGIFLGLLLSLFSNKVKVK